jgi:pyridoxine/pyridoxamine 5'-phosphate oxidase
MLAPVHDPLAAVSAWLEEARERVPEPHAMTLATASARSTTEA